MATTSISGLPETTTINAATVAPMDYSAGTYKVSMTTLGSFITNNATTVSATGNINGANLIVSGVLISANTVSASGNVTANNGMFTNIVNVASHTGTVVSVTGTVTGASHTGTVVSVTGAVTAGSISVTGGTITSNISGTVLSATGNAAGIELGNVSASNTPYIDFHSSGNATADYDARIIASGGATLGSGTLSLVGASIVTPGTFTVNSGAAVTAIINGAGNGIGNIGSISTYFNTIYAQATTALYADLAEVYEADADYAPGTVVSFGGNKEVTISTRHTDPAVAGVISANPSYLMNNGLTADHRAIVALTGRVPTSVTGTVYKGSMMVSAGNGRACACATPAMGTVIGKALENFDGESGIIEIVVGRM